jgi:hypothetical protein
MLQKAGTAVEADAGRRFATRACSISHSSIHTNAPVGDCPKVRLLRPPSLDQVSQVRRMNGASAWLGPAKSSAVLVAGRTMCSCRLPSSPPCRPMRRSHLAIVHRLSLCQVFDHCGSSTMQRPVCVLTTAEFHPYRLVEPCGFKWRHAVYSMSEGTAAFSTTIAR